MEFPAASLIVAITDLVPLAPVRVSPVKEKVVPLQAPDRVPLTSPVRFTVELALLQVPETVILL